MEKNKIILIVIAILVIALAAVAAYIYTSDSSANLAVNKTENKTVLNADNITGNNTVGDNSTRANETNGTNATYKVYNPQSDKYVSVIGEKYDEEVNRWYTYDSDGVRYYNTRIN